MDHLSSCPPLSSLDFIEREPCFNISDLTDCENTYPCEVRNYLLRIHPLVILTRVFLSYGSLVIICLGIVLNLLSFYIFISSRLAKNGSGVYLIALAVCDTGNLIANILVGVLRGASEEFNSYFMVNEWLCRSHGVGVEVFQIISAWIVVAFTVERSLAVWYPMLFRQNRNYRAKVVVACITTVFTSFCLSKLFLTGFESNSVFGYKACPSNRLVWEGMAYVRIAFQTWIPTIIVFTFNCLMFWKLRKIKINRKRLTEYVRNPAPPNRPQAARTNSFINKPSPTNPMLVAVSLAYLILVGPLGAVQSVELHWNVHHKVPVATNWEPQRSAYVYWKTYSLLIKYIRSFFFGFYQLNFAINFFLYFAAGIEFRRHLLKKVRHFVALYKLRCCCTQTPLEGGNNNNSSGINSGVSCATTTSSLVTLPPSSLIVLRATQEEEGEDKNYKTMETTL